MKLEANDQLVGVQVQQYCVPLYLSDDPMRVATKAGRVFTEFRGQEGDTRI